MDKKALAKRVDQALAEMYDAAENIFGRKISWEEVQELAPQMEEGGEKQLPWTAFYLSQEQFDEILAKYTKGLRWSYVWPYKIYYVFTEHEIENKLEEIRKMSEDPDADVFWLNHLKKEVEFNDTAKQRNDEFHKYNEEREDAEKMLEEKRITRKEYNEIIEGLVKKYNLRKRSFDRETVQFNVCDLSPTCCKQSYDQLKEVFEHFKGTNPSKEELQEYYTSRGWGHSVLFHDVYVALALYDKLNKLN